MPTYSIKAEMMRSLTLLYPNGVSSKEQHRDVIRAYCMGWGDCAMALGNAIAATEWVKQLEGTQEENWWPDSSWIWWSDNSFKWN